MEVNYKKKYISSLYSFGTKKNCQNNGFFPFIRKAIEWTVIISDLEDIGINAGNWVDSAQDRNYWRALVNAALNLRVP